jgi:hypothetical protein
MGNLVPYFNVNITTFFLAQAGGGLNMYIHAVQTADRSILMPQMGWHPASYRYCGQITPIRSLWRGTA